MRLHNRKIYCLKNQKQDIGTKVCWHCESDLERFVFDINLVE